MAQEPGLPDIQVDRDDAVSRGHVHRPQGRHDPPADAGDAPGRAGCRAPGAVLGPDAVADAGWRAAVVLRHRGELRSRMRWQRFPAAVQAALEQAIEEAREYRREASSRIVVPDVAGGGDSRRRQDQAVATARQSQVAGDRGVHDAAVDHVQSVAQSGVGGERILPALVGQRLHVGKRRVVERQRGGARHGAGHVGDAVVGDAVHARRPDRRAWWAGWSRSSRPGRSRCRPPPNPGACA